MRALGLLGSVDLPGQVGAVAVARAYVRVLLDAVRFPDAALVELLISELVANAVQHSDSGRRPRGVVKLVVSDTRHVVHVDVIDEGSDDAIPQIPSQVDPLSEHGRGLWLIRELASAWGWAENEAGRVVWFEVAK